MYLTLHAFSQSHTRIPRRFFAFQNWSLVRQASSQSDQLMSRSPLRYVFERRSAFPCFLSAPLFTRSSENKFDCLSLDLVFLSRLAKLSSF